MGAPSFSPNASSAIPCSGQPRSIERHLLGAHRLRERRREVREVILATGTTVEGEATAHYIHEMATANGAAVSRIAQGVPMGGELEFVDGVTLAHALKGRQPVQG